MTAIGSEPDDPVGGVAVDQITVEPTLPAVPYGEWPSPIAAAEIARAPAAGSFPTVVGSSVWWQQVLPEEAGRTTVMQSTGGKSAQLLPAPWNARTRVHEYGGLSYLPVPRAAAAGQRSERQTRAPRGQLLVFANFADQRLYLVPGSTAP